MLTQEKDNLYIIKFSYFPIDVSDLFIPSKASKYAYLPPEFSFNSSEYYDRIEIDYWMIGTLIYEMFYRKPLINHFVPQENKI